MLIQALDVGIIGMSAALVCLALLGGIVVLTAKLAEWLDREAAEPQSSAELMPATTVKEIARAAIKAYRHR